MFEELFNSVRKIELYEGFTELLGEVPGIDEKARRIFQAALKADFISTITDLPGDKIPDLETMFEDLYLHLQDVADLASTREEEGRIRDVADYFERHKDDKGIVASGYLKYLILPLSIGALKEEGLWDEEEDEPIMPSRKYWEKEKEEEEEEEEE